MTSPAPAVRTGCTNEICPALQYDVVRCGPNCFVEDAGTTLVNEKYRDEFARPGAYKFCGTCSSRPLTRTCYFEVRVTCRPRTTVPDGKEWCEVGVVEEAAVRDFICGHIDDSSQDAVTATFARYTTRDGADLLCAEIICKGRSLMIVAMSDFDPQVSEVLLGILLDSRFRRVYFIHVGKVTEIYHVDFQTREPLFFMTKTTTTDFCGAEVRVELVTGDRVEMSDDKRRLILRLLQKTR